MDNPLKNQMVTPSVFGKFRKSIFSEFLKNPTVEFSKILCVIYKYDAVSLYQISWISRQNSQSYSGSPKPDPPSNPNPNPNPNPR